MREGGESAKGTERSREANRVRKVRGDRERRRGVHTKEDTYSGRKTSHEKCGKRELSRTGSGIPYKDLGNATRRLCFAYYNS